MWLPLSLAEELGDCLCRRCANHYGAVGEAI